VRRNVKQRSFVNPYIFNRIANPDRFRITSVDEGANIFYEYRTSKPFISTSQSLVLSRIHTQKKYKPPRKRTRAPRIRWITRERKTERYFYKNMKSLFFFHNKERLKKEHRGGAVKAPPHTHTHSRLATQFCSPSLHTHAHPANLKIEKCTRNDEKYTPAAPSSLDSLSLFSRLSSLLPKIISITSAVVCQ
jgi:hypothetical protein